MNVLLSAAAAVAVAASAQAAQLAGDDFSYVGALTSNGWTAHSGAGNKVIMANGSYATLDQSSGSGEDVNMSFAAQGAADTTWYGFDLTMPAAANADIANVDADGLYFAHLKTSGNFFQARAFVGAPTGGGDFSMAIGAGSSMSAGTPWGSDLSFDTTYRVIANYNAATGEHSMWIDPASQASTSVTNLGAFTGDIVEQFALRQSSDYTGEQWIDNVLVGMSFADVFPTPGTLALLGIGGIACTRRRR